MLMVCARTSAAVPSRRPQGRNRLPEDAGLRERGGEQEPTERCDTRPADLVQPDPGLPEVGALQGDAEEGRTGKQQDDGRDAHHRGARR